MDIILEGLTIKQMLLAEIIWNLQETEQVNAFIRSLPRADALDCMTVVKLMQIAVVDQYCDGTTEMDEAEQVLKQFALKS